MWKWSVLVLLVVGIYSLSPTVSSGSIETKMVYEQRTYYAPPGKMAALHARFRDHTCRLFQKHGMKLVGFFSPIDEKEAAEKMTYILAHDSNEAAEKSWKAFRADPDWIKAKTESEKDGTLVSKIETSWLIATDYSPLK